MGKQHVQRWGPDTCGCQIVMVKDDRDDPTQDYHFIMGSIVASDGSPVEGMVVCPDHKGLTRAGVWETVLSNHDSENKRKNKILGQMMDDLSLGLSEEKDDGPELEDHPVLGQVPKLDAQGLMVMKRVRDFKPWVQPRFVFKGTGLHRTLEVWVVGMAVTAEMRTKLDACALQCGSTRAPIKVMAHMEIG